MSDPNDWFHEPDIKEGYARDIYPVRWKAYKKGAQTKKKGRWQRMNEYGGWENCDRPNVVFVSFEQASEIDALRARAEKAEAERDAAQAQVAALADALAFARPLVLKWCHTQGNDEDFIESTLARLDIPLADTAQAAADHDRRVRADTLEEAARIADKEAREMNGYNDERSAGYVQSVHCENIADAIRALADRRAKDERPLPHHRPNRHSSLWPSRNRRARLPRSGHAWRDQERHFKRRHRHLYRHPESKDGGRAMTHLNDLIDLAHEWPLGAHVYHERDGFDGSVQGYYITREGRPGLVVQMHDKRIVHVYHTKWLCRTTDREDG